MEPKARVEILDLLRAIAAISVAWFHFTNGGRLLQEGWLKSTGSMGWLGVEIFFVISGFIIPFSLLNASYHFPGDMGRFVLKRVIRLDPPYLAAVVLTVLLWFGSAATPGFQGKQPQLDLVALLLHVGYLNGLFGYPWAIVVLWTLAIEFQFYLTMAVVFPLLIHSSRHVRLLVLLSLSGLSLLPWPETLMFRYLSLFALGIVTFHYHSGMVSLRTYLALMALFCASTAESLSGAGAVAGLFSGLAIAFVRIPRLRPFVFLGGISYSLYLVHVPIGGRVVNLGTRFASTTMSQIAVLLAAMTVTIIAAFILNRVLERPAQRLASSIRYGQSDKANATSTIAVANAS